MKRALILGITGQLGSYMAEHLIEEGYTIYGLVRRTSTTNLSRLDAVRDAIRFIEGDLLDGWSLIRALRESRPDEIYNYAAQSFVGTSWQQPDLTMQITGLGVTRLLEAMRIASPEARLWHASSSEMFGNSGGCWPSGPFAPRSPYGVAKLAAHHAVLNYRESFGLWACCGIMFNCESPRRGPEFVTQKIATGVARIEAGLQSSIELGNLSARRDWGHAADYVRGAWLQTQQSQPGEYVFATGESHSIREFITTACRFAGLSLPDSAIVTRDALRRPADIDVLRGDPTLAEMKLRWNRQYDFERLVAEMVQAARTRIRNGE